MRCELFYELHEVNMSTATQTPLLTAEEFALRHNGDHYELVDGILEALVPAGARHGQVCFRSSILIGGFVDEHKLGLICCNDTFVLTQRDPDRVRGADVVFWSRNRWNGSEVPDGILDTPPDLVVEVRSPHDRWGTMLAKVAEYLNSGVGVGVVLDPKTTSASIHRQDELQQVRHNGDEFDLPDVLPGFKVPVAKFFG